MGGKLDIRNVKDGAKEFESARILALESHGAVTEANPGGLVDAVMEVDCRGHIRSMEDIFIAGAAGDALFALLSQIVFRYLIDAHETQE